MRTIYTPGPRAREYSPLALNIYEGCSHGCTYCYNLSMPWCDKEKFRQPRPRYGLIPHLEKDADRLVSEAQKKGLPTDPRPILLCFSCDPYPDQCDTILTQQALQVLHDRNLCVQVLTKGGMRAARDFDLYLPDRLGWKFGTTLHSLSEKTRQTWEPGSAPIEDRLEAIETARSYGIHTFLSVEPVIYPSETLEMLREMRDQVDEFRLGKMNHNFPIEKAIDWRDYLCRAREILAGRNVFIKSELLTTEQGKVWENDTRENLNKII